MCFPICARWAGGAWAAARPRTMRLATLRTTMLLCFLAVGAQVETTSARAPQRPQARERPPTEARGPPEGTAGAARPRARTSQPAGRTARSGRRRRRRRRGQHSTAGRMLGSLPSAAATVARLAGNASVAAGRLAARLATPAPWAALRTNVSRAALSSRRWASARARTLQLDLTLTPTLALALLPTLALALTLTPTPSPSPHPHQARCRTWSAAAPPCCKRRWPNPNP